MITPTGNSRGPYRVYAAGSDASYASADVGGKFSRLYTESEIRLEIAAKSAKLPDPNVVVDPRAITKMAEDKDFYHKVMEKINSFTENPNIQKHYPLITYSLEIMEDGDWRETMVDEVLKKKCEASGSGDGEGDSRSIFDMLADVTLSETEAQAGSPSGDVIYNYNVGLDLKANAKNNRKEDL